MQEVVEDKEVFAVGDLTNPKNLLFLELSKRDFSKIVDTLSENDRHSFSMKMEHPYKGEIILYHFFYFDKFPTNQIKGYFCSNCNKEYDEQPTKETFIEPPWKTYGEGGLIGFYLYTCNHCDNRMSGDVGIREEKSVELETIVRDDRGLFIQKNKDDVEAQLNLALKGAREGQQYPTYNYLRLAEYWAKNLSMDISHRIKEIKGIKEEAYFKGYQENLPEVIKELEKHSDLVGYSHHLLGSEDEMTGLTYEEGSGFSEVWGEFIKYIPKLAFTPELKQRTLEILTTIKRNTINRKKTLEGAMEQKKKEFREAITESEKEVSELKLLEDLVKQK